MARLPYPDPSTLPVDVRRSYDAFPKKLNIVRMMAHLGGCYTPLFQLGGAILTKQKLSPLLRKLSQGRSAASARRSPPKRAAQRDQTSVGSERTSRW